MHWDLLTDSNNSRSVFYSNKSRHGFSLPKPLVSTPEFKMLAIVQFFQLVLRHQCKEDIFQTGRLLRSKLKQTFTRV